jgi:hypothetical protein
MATVTASCAVTPARRRPVTERRVTQRPVSRARASQPAGLTLTRRGRLVVALGVLALVLAAFVGLVVLLLGPTATPASATTSSAAAGVVSAHSGLATITVRSGETLWAIATRVAPNADPRETITAIEQVNNLRTGYVYAGQRLVVPSTR